MLNDVDFVFIEFVSLEILNITILGSYKNFNLQVHAYLSMFVSAFYAAFLLKTIQIRGIAVVGFSIQHDDCVIEDSLTALKTYTL